MPASPSTSRSPRARPRAAADETAIDTYAMTNLFPRSTGLPLTVWVGPRGRARHAARIEVSLTPSKMEIDRVAVVAIRPVPRLVAGKLGPSELSEIGRWVRLNEAALLEFRDEAIDSVELGARLRRLGAAE